MWSEREETNGHDGLWLVVSMRLYVFATARTWNSLTSEVTSHLRLNSGLICFPLLSHRLQSDCGAIGIFYFKFYCIVLY